MIRDESSVRGIGSKVLDRSSLDETTAISTGGASNRIRVTTDGSCQRVDVGDEKVVCCVDSFTVGSHGRERHLGR